MTLGELLPHLNAALNATSAVLIVSGYVAIKSKKRELHKKLMLGALTAGVVFLISYLVRMGLTGHQVFPGQGTVRTVYLAVLLSHTILAVLNVPLIIRVVYLAVKERFAEHRRIARIALPIWLYVSVTGVVVYWMLYHLRPEL